MTLYTPPPKFLVAFSLAGEQRDIIHPVARAVEEKLRAPNVFYDEWFEHFIAGPDADLKLKEIYGDRCVLAVVCVSESYGKKPWTRAEHAAIRARYMKASENRDQLGILPIRVGDGEVNGIEFSSIVPDIREKSVDEAAQLILDRLQLIMPGLGKATASNSRWPKLNTSLHWPVADHSEACSAFEHLLSQDASFRLLTMKGPSEVGKTHITRQMLRNALHMRDLACGRFDFKGSANLENEVEAFVQHLEVDVPTSEQKIFKSLGGILDVLRKRARPTLLIFDTYEQVGEAKYWMENTLLPSLIRSEWLRVVIAGQQVPENSAAMLEAVASPMVHLRSPSPEEWFEFGRQHRPDLELEFVVQAHKYTSGSAALLAGLFGPGR